MTKLADRVTVDSEQCGGRPCIHGMRICVSDVLDLLANGLSLKENGLSLKEIIQEMPDLELEDVRASLRLARRRVNSFVIEA